MSTFSLCSRSGETKKAKEVSSEKVGDKDSRGLGDRTSGGRDPLLGLLPGPRFLATQDPINHPRDDDFADQAFLSQSLLGTPCLV